jgi:NAD(P)-dependent dehydrogenase (short-subunit alcohol dehydrogenase family)
MKTVVITGVNRGIGLALAKKFLAESFVVIGTTRKGTIDSIFHENFYGVSLDVTSSESIIKAVEFIINKFPKIDLLINNAGVGIDLNNESPEIDVLKVTFETNVFGLFSWTEAIKDYIVDGGTIFNISSVMGMLNRDKILPNATAYRMSKSALNMYTKTLSARLAVRNVRVVSIHPGWVKTDMGGQEADITTEFCANGIYELYIKNIPTNSFWAAETQTQLNW